MALRSQLAQSAMSLLDERGWSEVTASDIAQNAGISVRTFYRHFANKSDAFWPILHEHMKIQHQAFIDSDEPDIVERAADALVASYEKSHGGLEGAHRTYRLLFGVEELSSVWLRSALEAETEYTKAIETAFPEYSDPHDARLVAAIIVTCVRVSLYDWVNDKPETLRAHAMHAFERANLHRKN
ncbi:hypothetical protein CJ179_01315 [Rhodococcus sp. ACS1]|nr:hypothetical protein CJ179_01315 [Rhodococcus sp. ACS1]